MPGMRGAQVGPHRQHLLRRGARRRRRRAALQRLQGRHGGHDARLRGAAGQGRHHGECRGAVADRDRHGARRWPRRPSRIPLGRFGTPEECAQIVMMLVGNEYMTGQTVALSGGMSFVVMLRILGKASSINVRKVLWTCEEIGIAYTRADDGPELDAEPQRSGAGDRRRRLRAVGEQQHHPLSRQQVGGPCVAAARTAGRAPRSTAGSTGRRRSSTMPGAMPSRRSCARTRPSTMRARSRPRKKQWTSMVAILDGQLAAHRRPRRGRCVHPGRHSDRAVGQSLVHDAVRAATRLPTSRPTTSG